MNTLSLKKIFVNSSILLLFWHDIALSEDKASKLTPVESLLPMLGGLLFVLLLIFVLAYIFKRFTNFTPNSKSIKIVESQMIGSKEKLMIVKVNGQSFLLGVTANSINQLGELTCEEDLSVSSQALESIDESPDNQSANVQPSFKSVLSNVVRGSLGMKVLSSNQSAPNDPTLAN
ncbi:MAG: flagellar biosynthetic protein FliO [Kangiellaceae bacterium]|nr:flagellar biosynthetic protein FliO [Kangiellaceae bacterium]